MRNKKLARLEGMTSLAGSPLTDSRGHPLAGPTFLQTNTLARPAKARQSEHAWVLLARAKGSTFFSYKSSLKLNRLGGWPFFPGQLFSLSLWSKANNAFISLLLKNSPWGNAPHPHSRSLVNKGASLGVTKDLDFKETVHPWPDLVLLCVVTGDWGMRERLISYFE